jgi:hypothetical protein
MGIESTFACNRLKDSELVKRSESSKFRFRRMTAFVSRSAAGLEEMGEADHPLAGSPQPLYHSVARTHACFGKGCAMIKRKVSTLLGRGREMPSEGRMQWAPVK